MNQTLHNIIKTAYEALTHTPDTTLIIIWLSVCLVLWWQELILS